MRLYLDGCSFTYGLGLAPEHTLSGLWQNEYEVINKSRPGKSNLAIALDAFENIPSCDVIIIGWTFSSRSYLKYQNYDIDLLPTRTVVELPFAQDTKIISDIYTDLHRNFYSLHDSDFADQHSNFLVSSINNLCLIEQKKLAFFSAEKRKTNAKIYYPVLSPAMRLSDGHWNQIGTKHVHTVLQQLIYEQYQK
jgi:hypothetical protein